MSITSIFGSLFKFGICLVVFLAAFDYYFKEGKNLIVTPPGIKQVQLPTLEEPQNILDKNGSLKFTGWGVNMAEMYHINYKDAKSAWLPDKLNFLKFRAFNFILMYLPDHIIQIPLANFGACGVSIQVYPTKPAKDIIKNKRIQESPPWKCPDIDLDSTVFGNRTFFQDGDFLIDITKQEDGNLFMELNAPKINFQGRFTLLIKDVDVQFYALPLTHDKLYFQTTNKQQGIPTFGTYRFDNLTYHCARKECLSMYDIGRGQFTYQTSWFWATLSTYLPNKSIFALTMGDGIGAGYDTKEKFYVDFITMNGKHYKLDQTRIQYNPSNYSETHVFHTIKDEKVFQDRGCDLKFEPVGVANDGIDALILAFTQELIYGYWNGECHFDGQTAQINHVLGTVEHVRARW